MTLSEDEQKLLEQYQKLPTSLPYRLNRVAVEIVPPAIFVGLGIYTRQMSWFIVVIALMVIYNVQRVLRQDAIIRRLQSISHKVIGPVEDGPAD
jgi:hypothetical protein